METTFPHDSSQALSQEQRYRFYQTMKRTVVQTIGRIGRASRVGSGIIIDCDCRILTTDDNAYSGDKKAALFIRLNGGNRDIEVRTVHRSLERNMAILEPCNPVRSEFGYVRMSDSEVHAGLDVYCIGYPGDLFLQGQVAFPCRLPSTDKQFTYRDVRHVIGSLLPGVRLEPSLQLIQISNIHQTYVIFGAPVFDSNGHVLGMLSFDTDMFHLAIHHVEMFTFIQQFKDGKKRKGNTGHAKGNKKMKM